MKQRNRNCNRDNEMIERQSDRSKPSGNNQEKERQRREKRKK